MQIMKDLKELLHLVRSFFMELLIIKSRRIRNVRLGLSLQNIGFQNRSGNNRRLDVSANLGAQGVMWLLGDQVGSL
nr:hypothetical protein [Tanacetum cinerariifolium]